MSAVSPTDEHESIFAAYLSTLDYLKVDGAVREAKLLGDVWQNRIEAGLSLTLNKGEPERLLDAEQECVDAANLLLGLSRSARRHPLARAYRRVSPFARARQNRDAQLISRYVSGGMAHVPPAPGDPRS